MGEKCILVVQREPALWVDRCFPRYSALSLPLAGKPIVEHQLDRCARIGATRVLALDVSFDRRICEELGDGSRWGLKFDYRPCPPGATVEELVERSRDFFGGERPVVVEGPEFYHYEEPVRITSLREYFDANLKVLADPGECVLPGYASDRGVVLGMNVQIRMGCVVTSPVLLDDNVLIDYECRLNGHVVVGEGCIIDRRATLHRAIVFPRTYVARGVELEDKIVVGARVIDPITGACVNLADDVLSSDLSGKRRWVPFRLMRLARFFRRAFSRDAG